MSGVEVSESAVRFGRSIRWRNRRELAAAAIVVVCFAAFLWLFDNALLRLGSAMTIAATVFVSWQLLRRTSRDDPADVASDVQSHYRSRLQREHDMLKAVPVWYLLPFVPGFIVFATGKLSAGAVPTIGWLALNIGVPVLIFGGVWWLNDRAARRLQDEIASLF